MTLVVIPGFILPHLRARAGDTCRAIRVAPNFHHEPEAGELGTQDSFGNHVHTAEREKASKEQVQEASDSALTLLPPLVKLCPCEHPTVHYL